MNEQSKNTNPYSLEDIERYLQGKLSPAEMHELEKAAVQDPFLADAIEGYQATDLTLIKQDIADLHTRLSAGPAKIIPASKQNGWWRVAAAVVLLAGTGILGLKLFTGKNNTQEIAKTEVAIPLQKKPSYLAESMTATKETVFALQKKETDSAIQKNALLANNNRMLLSLKKSETNNDLTSLDIKSLQPVAALPAKPYLPDEMMVSKDTASGKIPARDIVAANAIVTRSSGLSPQSNSAREVNIYQAFDPALAAKKGNINTMPASGSITIGAEAADKGKKINDDTINLKRSEMFAYSQTGNLKPTTPAITSLGNSSAFTIAGNNIAGKRGVFTLDTPVLTDQKRMYVTFSESAKNTSGGTLKFDTPKQKKDTDSSLSEIIITNSYDRFAKKEPVRTAGATSGNSAKKETVANERGSSYMVNPTSGWYDFTKYLANKIATKKDIGEHGTVEIKMNISENGKVSKVRILKSFNTQLNPILIKAIRKGPRWQSTDYLAKKDFIFKVDL